jgi:Holliday junction DNA helicase RuvA
VVVTAAGIGFQLYTSSDVIRRAKGIGSEIFLNTYMQVREDGMFLFGFTEERELDIFKQLISVSGVGPKVGLGLLSTFSPDDLIMAILSGDAKTLSKAPGVGKKVAERIILDLRDKMDRYSSGYDDEVDIVKPQNSGRKDVIMEAAEALNALGFSMTEAMKKLNSVDAPEDATAEVLIKLALKKM